MAIGRLRTDLGESSNIGKSVAESTGASSVSSNGLSIVTVHDANEQLTVFKVRRNSHGKDQATKGGKPWNPMLDG